MILTKLQIPLINDRIVRRNRLSDKLDEALNRKLTIVSAPAGFGKTTLISSWINQNNIESTWVSLDESDNAPEEFLSYIILGLQQFNSDFGIGAMKLLESANNPNPRSIANILINDSLTIEQDIVLILDDFHFINNHEVFTLVGYLLENIPNNFHILISTRSDPILPLSRLRSQQQLLEIRSGDLNFSEKEISKLFNKTLQLGLSDSEIHSIALKTEGWIAGLQLAALSINNYENKIDFIKNFSGNDRYIMDYLIEEVLNSLSEEIKNFLLKTSILEQFSGSLCNEILGIDNSQSIIEELEKKNIFIIPLDNVRHWFRFHHLFADLLKQRLSIFTPDIVSELHNKASDWFEKNELFDLAINHALKVNNSQKSINILDKIIENMWMHGKHSAILKYGSLLPNEVIQSNPNFCFYYSWILISAGEVEIAKPFLTSSLNKINKILQDQSLDEDSVQFYTRLLGKIFLAFAYSDSALQNPTENIEYCKNAINNFSEEDNMWLGWANYLMANALIVTGDFQNSYMAYKNGLEYSKKSNHLYLLQHIGSSLATHEMGFGHYKASYKLLTDVLNYIRSSNYTGIETGEASYSSLFTIKSVVETIWTDFDNSLKSITNAAELSKSDNNIFNRISVLLAHSYLLFALDDKKGAMQKIVEFEAILKNFKVSPFLSSTYIGWKINLLIDANKLTKAVEFAEEKGLSIDSPISYETMPIFLFYIRLFIAQNKYEDANRKLDEFYHLVNVILPGGQEESLVQLKIMSAIIEKKNDNSTGAINYLVNAMELASIEGLMNYFLFDYEFFKDELKEIFNNHTSTYNKIPKEFIAKLQDTLEKKKKRRNSLSEMDLSKRELEILKLIASNASNQEIADKSFISLNTVKTHVRHILWKLGVDRRSQAVTKAKELGIL